MRHFLELSDLSADELEYLLAEAGRLPGHVGKMRGPGRPPRDSSPG